MSVRQDALNYRREKGYTQTQFAEILGIPQPTLSEFENGVKMPSVEHKRKIFNFLKEKGALTGNLESENVRDTVNPDHYKNRKYEVFDVLEDTQGYERHAGYLEGCVIKYIMRWDKKEKPLDDLRKAERYLQQLIQHVEKGKK